jgi:formylglycine-generating enzyme required for sulfatase activity
MNASWTFTRSGADGGPTWLDHLRDPVRPRVAGLGAGGIVQALMAGLPDSTVGLLGSAEALEDILRPLMHPANGLIDPAGVRISPAFTWSRGDVLASMGGMVAPLEELMTEARSQAQAEAVRQFQIAREAFSDRRHRQSLEALGRAIDIGPSLQVAGRLAWRVYLLRALVLLGSEDNADPAVVDPAEAEQSFLLAARFARKEYRLDAARALLGAGWAAYVKETTTTIERRLANALLYTVEALDLDGDLTEAQFQSAKFRMALGDVDQALRGLRWLPVSGRILLLKAAADGDFRLHSGRFEAFMGGLQEEQRTRIRDEVTPEAERIVRWMQDCPDLAALPAARRLVDLSQNGPGRGVLEVQGYLGSGLREDRETLRESFFEARRLVTREWDEEIQDPPPGTEAPADPSPGSRIVHHVDQEPEFRYFNGLGEILFTYRGDPGSRKVYDLPPGPGTVALPVRWIPPGQFLRGSPVTEPGREPDEALHSVILPHGFFLTETPCTQAQWSRIMAANPSRFHGPDLPVEQVNWEEAREYARRLTEFHRREGRIAAGWRWDLPTEAQWEYACRVRKPGVYHGPIEAVAWYQANSGKRTHPVGGRPPNGWGLRDMHGNVAKWCLDWYGPYPSDMVRQPAGPLFGTFRVYRGGGWSDEARCCRSAFRGRSVPDFRSSNIGFSLVLSGPLMSDEGDGDPAAPSPGSTGRPPSSR